MPLTPATASRPASIALCGVAFGAPSSATGSSCFGRVASAWAGAPPVCAGVGLRVPRPVRIAPAGSRCCAFACGGSLLRIGGALASVLQASARLWLGLRAALPGVLRCTAACGRSPSAIPSRLTIRSSRRRFAARLNSGVRQGEKLSSAVGSGNGIAPGIHRVVWGRLRCPSSATGSSCFGRVASAWAGAPPVCAGVGLPACARFALRRQVRGVAPSHMGGRCFGSAAPRLRFCKPRPACGLACGQRCPVSGAAPQLAAVRLRRYCRA